MPPALPGNQLLKAECVVPRDSGGTGPEESAGTADSSSPGKSMLLGMTGPCASHRRSSVVARRDQAVLDGLPRHSRDRRPSRRRRRLRGTGPRAAMPSDGFPAVVDLGEVSVVALALCRAPDYAASGFPARVRDGGEGAGRGIIRSLIDRACCPLGGRTPHRRTACSIQLQ